MLSTTASPPGTTTSSSVTTEYVFKPSSKIGLNVSVRSTSCVNSGAALEVLSLLNSVDDSFSAVVVMSSSSLLN